jgi:hypothetical protein
VASSRWSGSCELSIYGSGESEMYGKELMYRNEAMDATHLAEFFQVEGVVADYDITLGNLVGMSFPPPVTLLYSSLLLNSPFFSW